MTTQAGQTAAWDTHQALTKTLLPALRNGEGQDVLNSRLAGVVIRIRRYAPMWPGDGLILLAAAASAVRLLRHGDRAALAALSQAMAARLYTLAAGRRHLPRPGAGHQKTLSNKRLQLDTDHLRPGQLRNGQQRHQKGSSHD